MRDVGSAVLLGAAALPVLYTAIRFGQFAWISERARSVWFGALVVTVTGLHFILAIVGSSGDLLMPLAAICFGLLLLNAGHILYRNSE